MSLRALHSKLGKVDVLLHKNKLDEALKELTDIIDELVKDSALVQNEEARDLLTVSCLKRVDLNYKKQKFQDILSDVKVLESINYDIHSDFDLFLKKQEAQSEVHKNNLNSEFQKVKIYSPEIEAVKENISLNFDIDKMHSRTIQKPPKKQKTN